MQRFNPLEYYKSVSDIPSDFSDVSILNDWLRHDPESTLSSAYPEGVNRVVQLTAASVISSMQGLTSNEKNKIKRQGAIHFRGNEECEFPGGIVLPLDEDALEEDSFVISSISLTECVGFEIIRLLAINPNNPTENQARLKKLHELYEWFETLTRLDSIKAGDSYRIIPTEMRVIEIAQLAEDVEADEAQLPLV